LKPLTERFTGEGVALRKNWELTRPLDEPQP
jgi:hypothetical protein